MPQARDEAGNIWEVDAQGNPVRLVQAAQQQAQPIAPVDPRIGPTVRKDVAEANKTEATLPGTVTKTNADATKAQNEAAQSYPDRPTLTPNVYKDALDAYNSARQLDTVISDLEGTFKAGPGATKGVLGVEDALPLPSMQNFNRAGNSARGIILRAMGFAATQANTPGEVKMNIGAYIPSASDYDSTIQAKIDSLKTLRDFTLKNSVRLLGGVPSDTGRIIPLDEIPAEQQPKSIKDGTPLWAASTVPQGGGPSVPPSDGGSNPHIFFTPGTPPQAAAPDATTKQAPIPPEMQAENDQWLGQNIGKFTPEAYANFRLQLDRKYGFSAPQGAYENYLENGKQIQGALRNGGDINTTLTGPEVGMTDVERRQNASANSAIGGTLVGVANAGSFGGVQALAPDQFNAITAARPGAVLGGEVLGSIGATNLLSGASRAALKTVAPRLAPTLLKDTMLANRLRELGVDTTYGAIYGQNTQGDPLNGALAAGIGSAGGQAVGKVLGDVVGGVATSPAVQRLKDAGVNLTTGQTLGGLAKGIEDRMTSIPVVGDMVNARRMGGYQDFQRAAFNEGLSPIGASVKDTGERGVEEAKRAVSDAYTQALGGKAFVPDQPFHNALSQRVASMMSIPKVGPDAAYAVREAIIPHVQPNGTIPGQSFQNIRHDLLTAARKLDNNEAATGKAAGDEVRGVVNAVDEMVQRQDPAAYQAYSNANEAYMQSQVLRKAVSAAKNTEGMFSPAQLGNSAERNAARYGGRDATTGRPFFQLQRDAQMTLPSKIPDSGTASRLAQMGLGGGLLAGGAGIGAATSDNATQGAQSGATTALTLGALMTLMGTRGGQRVLNTALTERPAYMRKLSDIMLSRPDIWGPGGVPLAIASTQQ